MTIDQLLTLDAIVKQGSFKAASEILHKSQPSLSVAIKNLEEEFGILIFNRDGYRPVLTETGKHFYKKAQITINEYRKLQKLGDEMGKGHETEINLCVDAIFPIASIKSVLSDYMDPLNCVSINLNTDVLDGVMSKLKKGEVDFALGPATDDKEIESIKVQEVELIPVIAPDLAKKVKSNLELLKSFPLIVVESSIRKTYSSIPGSIGDNYWFTTDFYMKEQLIEAGLGWGRLPSHQVELALKNKRLVRLEGFKQIQAKEIPLYILRMKNRVMGPNTKSLWNSLCEIK